MPKEKKVEERYKYLNRYFKSSEGYTYYELCGMLEDEGICVDVRTIKEDVRYFKSHYNAHFVEDAKRGKQKLLRYKDPGFSVFKEKLTSEEKHRITRLIESLYAHDDLPQFQWMLCVLEGLVNIDNAEDLTRYIEFSNNIDLAHMEDNFKPLLEACMKKEVVTLQYAPYKYLDTPRIYTVFPYRLKQFNNRWFLICRSVGYESITIFAIDRILQGTIKKEAGMCYEEPDWGKIDVCLEQTIGVTDAFSVSPVCDVKLLINRDRYSYIKTKPIIRWQKEIDRESTKESVCLLLEGVRVNKELIALILSFGNDVEVLSPDSLRLDIENIIRSMCKLYKL